MFNKIFVIRPSSGINIKVIERNKNKLQRVYDLGIKDCKKRLKKLKEYFIDKKIVFTRD